MSKGGGTKQTTQNTSSTTNQSSNENSSFFSGNTASTRGGSTTNPWAASVPGILGAMGGLQGSYQPALDAQLAALSGGLNTATSVYGGVPNLSLTDVTGALGGVLSGNGTGVTAGMGGDVSATLRRMMSGTPDYSGLQGAIDAANAPILRQLNNEIIPGLNQRATFLNNGTGGIKALNSVLPDVAARMGENAAALTNQERLRALGDQATGINLYSGLTGQANSQALQAASLFPQLSGLALMPSQLQQQMGALPFSMAQSLSGSLLPYAGLGNSTSTFGDQSTSASGGSSSASSGTSNATSTGETKQTTSGGGLGQVLGGLLTLGSMFMGGGPLSGLLRAGGGAAGSGSGFSLSS